VPERAVPDLRMGETIDIKVSALDRTFQGQIVRTSDQIDSDTRTMRTEVNIPNPKYQLVPGMYASAEIPLHQAINALSLPIQAVQATQEGQGTVMVVGPGNKLESRNVTLGLQSATDVEITSGLRENEMVVFGAQGQFRPDEVVTPKPVDASITD
jgi:RND family efflux transporter MFP subunit